MNTPKGTAGVQWNTEKRRRSMGSNDTRVWESRVQKRRFKRDGEWLEARDFSIRLKSGGRQVYFPLHTANRATAANLARKIATYLTANGMTATEAKYKRVIDQEQSPVTVGSYLEAVGATQMLHPRTLLGYTVALRVIASGAFGVRSGKGKFDYNGDGNRNWRRSVDKIRLERLTPDRINKWARRFIDGRNSLEEKDSAKRTLNAYFRNARSLFSDRPRNGGPSLLKAASKLLAAPLPQPLPLHGVGSFPAGSARYDSKISAELLFTAADTELRESDPPAYTAFLLALVAGLRRGEIDGLEWGHVDIEHNVIRIRESAWLHTKTKASAADVAIDPWMMAALRAIKSGSNSSFVVGSNREPKEGGARIRYRCEPVFKRLNLWLKSKGVSARKPLHELRKEVGAIIASKDGIYAASRYLRHATVAMTDLHYSDLKHRVTAGIGKPAKGLSIVPEETKGAA